MIKSLTKKQQKRIKNVVSRIRTPKVLKDPFERHQAVLHMNYDWGTKPLRWIVEQEDTDKATALLIYWTLAPAYLHNKFIKNNKLDKQDKFDYQLIKTIEKNIKNSFYQNCKFDFDPTDILGTDFTKEYKELNPRDLIPEQMYQKVEGEKIILLSLQNEHINIILKMDNSQMRKLEIKLNRGYKILLEKELNVNRNSNPRIVVKAIQSIVDNLTLRKQGRHSRKDQMILNTLDFLWAEQVCREFDWKWVMHELREQVIDEIRYVIISPDKYYYWWYTNYMMKNYATGYFLTNKNRIVDNFEAMGNINSNNVNNLPFGVNTVKELTINI